MTPACPADAGSICTLCFRKRKQSITTLTTKLQTTVQRSLSLIRLCHLLQWEKEIGNEFNFGMTSQEAVMIADSINIEEKKEEL